MGRNLWVRKDGRVINVGGKGTMAFGGGDTLVLETPGGGGWGAADEANGKAEEADLGGRRWEPRGRFLERENVDF